jgi:uncharacterized damage-inducible protein DinB
MATSAEQKERIEKIRALPALVADAVKGLRDDQLDTPYREGGWTVRQVVHHLADSHMNAFVRMKLIVTEETPSLKTYDQEDWARLVDSTKLPVESSVMILRGLHERWTQLMENLPPEAWKRTGIHPERGVMTLDELLTIYAEHGEKHVGTIAKLRKEKGW